MKTVVQKWGNSLGTNPFMVPKALFVVLCLAVCQLAFAQPASFEVSVPDQFLREALRDALGKDLSEFTPSDFERLTSLSAGNRGIQDLRGLELFPNLESLELDNSPITSLAPLGGLRKLRALKLFNTPLGNQQVLFLTAARFPLLTRLELGSARGEPRNETDPVTSNSVIEALSGFRNLESLGLWGLNDLDDAGFNRLFEAVLQESPELQELQLTATRITNRSLEKMATLRNLRQLALWDSKGITDLSALLPLRQLRSLWLQSTGLRSLKSVAALYEAGALHVGERLVDARSLNLDMTEGASDRLIVDKLLRAGVQVTYVNGNHFAKPVFPLSFALAALVLAMGLGVYVSVRSSHPRFLAYPLHVLISLLWILVLGGVLKDWFGWGEAANHAATAVAFALLNLTALFLVGATGTFHSSLRMTAVLAGLAVAGLVPLLTGSIPAGRVVSALALFATAATLAVLVLRHASARGAQRGALGAAFLVLAVLTLLESLPPLGLLAVNIVLSDTLWMTGLILEAALLCVVLMDASLRLERVRIEVRERVTREQRLAELGTMASKIAHEINNPNHVIGLQVAILRRLTQKLSSAVENGEARELVEALPAHLDSMAQASRQIESIVESMRAGVLRPEIPFGPVDLGALVAETVKLYEFRLSAGTNRFVLHLAPRALVVHGVASRLQQLVLNLINNALASLESPRSALEVRLEEQAGKPGAVLTVRDEGRGMTPETLAHLGEPFFSTRQATGGTGLGLSVCFDIAKEHQAQLLFESTPGVGTTVRFVIPLQPAHDV